MDNSLQVGDIFLVRFHPAFGSELKKYRPAVVIATTAQGLDERFVMIAPLSSNTRSGAKKAEVLISKKYGLDQDSLLLCWYVRTIDVRRLQLKIGTLPESKMKQIKAQLVRLF